MPDAESPAAFAIFQPTLNPTMIKLQPHKTRAVLNGTLPSANQLLQLFNTSSDLLCTISAEGRFVHVNRSCRHILGYYPEELIGRRMLDFVVEADHKTTLRAGKAALKGKDQVNFENRFQHKEGYRVSLQWSCHYDQPERLVYCVARDVSKAKAREKLHSAFEHKLKRKHRELLDMLNRMTDCFVALDTDFRIIYANAQTERVLNLNREEFLTRNVWEAFPEMTDSVFYEQYHRAMQQKVDVHFKGYLATFDTWFEVNVYPSDSGLSIFFRNITQRIKAEEERRAYEQKIELQHERLSGILDRMQQGFIALDNSLRVLDWNRKASEITGVTAEKALGEVITTLFPPEVVTYYLPLFIQALKSRISVHCELVGPISGRWHEFDLYPSGEGLSVFFKDIDERKRTEAELQKLSLIAKETENAVMMLNANRKVTWVNAAFTRMTGYTLEDLAGKAPASLLEGPETDPKMSQYIDELYNRRVPFGVEILNYRKNGEPFWTEVHIEPLFDEAGNIEQYFNIRKDITERKRLERELEAQQKKTNAAIIAAQEKERSLISQELHDSVNPVLTTVKLYQDLIQSDDENRDLFIEKSKELLQESINEIRRLSKRLSVPTLGIYSLSDSVNELLGNVAATNRFELACDTKPIENLDVEESLHLGIYRILQEQLTNVLKYAEASRVEIYFERSDKELRMLVTDDGKGFDPRKKRNGIGITNMKMRAESLNGTLRINSAPGEGCTLVATFPLAVGCA